MHIIVHTTRRHGLRGGTLTHLTDAGLNPVIVCPDDQEPLYKRSWPGLHVLPVPAKLSAKGLPTVQDYIAGRVIGAKDPALCMLDDDLFFTKRLDASKKRIKCTGVGLAYLFDDIATALETHDHVSIMANKDMGFQDPTPSSAPYGPTRSVLAYRVSALKHLESQCIFFSDVVSKSDYHIGLSMLERGMRTCILRGYGHEQCGGPDLPGGATEYRNEDMHEQASKQLHALHPKFVSVTTKVREGWTFQRTDVIVRWKAAYTRGLEVSNALP